MVFFERRHDLGSLSACDDNGLHSSTRDLRDQFTRNFGSVLRDQRLVFRIQHVLCQGVADQIFRVVAVDGLDLFNATERLDDRFVGITVKNTQKRSGQKFLLAVNVRVKRLVDIKFKFKPNPAMRDQTRGMKDLAVGVKVLFKRNTRRTVQLADDHTLIAINDECPGVGHHRHIADEYFLLFSLFGGLQTDLDL